jgi:hypothetical protein
MLVQVAEGVAVHLPVRTISDRAPFDSNKSGSFKRIDSASGGP